MAVVVLVLWLFTAGAGFYLLVTSNLGQARLASAPRAAQPAQVGAQTAPAAQVPAGQVPAGQARPAAQAAPPPPPARPSQTPPASPRETRRAARTRFDPPSLTAARTAPVVPGARALLEFAHPACGIIGLGFWLGFTFVHYLPLGWIAFGLVAVTASLGLAWFAASTRAASTRAANTRAAGAKRQAGPGPSFSSRMIALHGGAAALTLVLAALTALILRR